MKLIISSLVFLVALISFFVANQLTSTEAHANIPAYNDTPLTYYHTSKPTIFDAPVEVEEKNNYSDKDIECLARNIYFEARNQSVLGQYAVGWVTINRMYSEKFPNTVCGVVHQAVRKDGVPVRHKCQFSWYCDGKSDIITDNISYKRAVEIATELLNTYSNTLDVTDGATYYHANYVNPSWSRKFDKIVQIDRHIFYRP